MTKIKTLGLFLLGLAGLSAATMSHAKSPECETLLVDQPSPMNTALDIVYTWDTSCLASPEEVAVLRDDVEIGDVLDKKQDRGTIRFVGTLTGTTPGMHRVGVAVTLNDGDSYDLVDSVLVSGTSAQGAKSSHDDDSRSSGCFAAPAAEEKTPLLGLLTALLCDLFG